MVLERSTQTFDPADGASAVELSCRIDSGSIPDRLPEVVWRSGVDLNPLDVRDSTQVGWLETLVWPEDRRAALARILGETQS